MRADSLILNFQHSAANTVIDSLLQVQTKTSNYTKALLVKARILEKTSEDKQAVILALQILDTAEKYQFHETACSAHLLLALIQEKISNLKQCDYHLKEAKKLIDQHDLEPEYAHYCVRKSSYLRFTPEPDSALFYAKEALIYATKYNQVWHMTDANMMLGHMYWDSDPGLSIKHLKKTASYFMSSHHYEPAAYMYIGISSNYSDLDSLDLAFAFLDSAFNTHSLSEIPTPSHFYESKSKLYEKTGDLERAYQYAGERFNAFSREVANENSLELRKITAAYEDEKKKAAYENQIEINQTQNRQLISTICFSAGISIILVLLGFAYRKLKSNNERIEQQAEQLANALSQQTILLAEVQHRVKNNLQFVIALLELQKEATSGKTIEDITDESQQRIEAMTFLHEKIYLSDDLSKVNIKSYLEEVISLMKRSYVHEKKKISIQYSSDLESVSIEKAIPLGLIIVELINNSFKHAFHEMETGEITICASQSAPEPFSYTMTYSDNGSGFKTSLSKDGLGMEIINGLVGQLHGNITVTGEHGFNAEIAF
jgi:two-component sensor histidine kinase